MIHLRKGYNMFRRIRFLNSVKKSILIPFIENKTIITFDYSREYLYLFYGKKYVKIRFSDSKNVKSFKVKVLKELYTIRGV